MIPILLLALGQLTIRHEVVSASPTEASATLTIENPTTDDWDLVLYSFTGPPARTIGVLPPTAEAYPVGEGMIHVFRARLGAQQLAVAQVRVALPAGAGWAHGAFVDATNVRTGARLCEPRVRGTTPTGPEPVPTLSEWGIMTLTVALGAGLVVMRRRAA